MTPFYIAAQVIAWMAILGAWWKGGRIERLAAVVLACDYVVSGLVSRLPLPHAHEIAMGTELLTTLIFLWLAFRGDRWWLMAAAGALVLCSLTGVVGMAHPGVSYYAAASAQIGFWIVVYLSLLAGVGERWLAGEQAVSRLDRWGAAGNL